MAGQLRGLDLVWNRPSDPLADRLEAGLEVNLAALGPVGCLLGSEWG